MSKLTSCLSKIIQIHAIKIIMQCSKRDRKLRINNNYVHKYAAYCSF